MRKIIALIVSVLATFIICIFVQLNSVSTSFPQDTVFEIGSRDSLRSISYRLKEDGYIDSSLLFRLRITYLGRDKNIAAGIYKFDQPISLLEVANKISSGKYDIPAITITIPEGFTNEEIAERIVANIDSIDKNKFLEFASEYQGYLFPETYYFLGSETIEDIVLKMTDEFYSRIGDVSKSDLILASIVEGEAKSVYDMRVIAGILKERQSIGMRLQVDVATSTYKTIDLPPKPINNPGENAINAVKDPIYTKYLYYITGKDGKMYYAKTFKEHRVNIEKYLK